MKRQWGELVGSSAAIRKVYATLEKVASTDANVLVWGESGTGKEVLAQRIHDFSQRNSGPFVKVDLGAIVEHLFESELFGHTAGAFTGAAVNKVGRMQLAEKGSLFLDEISNLSLPLQAKLLTVLQQRLILPLGQVAPISVDFRLICATNQPLKELVQQGLFRQDLLYRINTVEIHLPPLRARKEDIRPLAEHFLQKYAMHYQQAVPQLTSSAWQFLQKYDWPGNVRQLQHSMERAVILGEGNPLPPEFIHAQFLEQESEGMYLHTLNLQEVEIQVIQLALRKHAGNITYAARDLGITRTSLYRRLEKYHINEDSY
ncbi:MAG: sigma-54 dependent transcriptional regulator [Bacteroidota bacterium]